MGTKAKVVEIIIAGGSTLKKSLKMHWPGREDNRVIPERNFTQHIGAIFIKKGYSVFAEHHFELMPKKNAKKNVSKNKHLDLFILDKENELEILIEAKRYRGSGTAKKIGEDITRIKDFKLDENSGQPCNERLGVILMGTKNPKIKEWWEKPKDNKFPESIKVNKTSTTSAERVWSLLKEELSGENSLQGVITLPGKDSKGHFLLYLVFSVIKKKN